MLRGLIFLQTVFGLYTAPMQDSKSSVSIRTQTGISASTTIHAVYDTSVQLLVFGGWTDDIPPYREFKSGMTYGMGPSAGPNGSIGPWVDTLNFNRLYMGDVPSHLITKNDIVVKEPWWTGGPWWPGTVLLSSYYSPNVVFTIRRPDVLEFVKDSNHAIFRVLRDDAQEVFIIARYNNRVDSLRVVTVKHSYCIPWPDCYYNPRWRND